jgi:hypothetical protein
MSSHYVEHEDDIIIAFNNTSSYLDDLPNIDDHYPTFVKNIYSNEWINSLMQLAL